MEKAREFPLSRDTSGDGAASRQTADRSSSKPQTPFKAEDFTFETRAARSQTLDYLTIRILNRSLDVSTLIIDLTVDGPHLESDKPSSSW